MMVSAVRSRSGRANVAPAGIWRAGLAAALAATSTNAFIYVLAVRTGTIAADVTVPGTDQPVTLASVVLASVVGALGATVIFALIGRVVLHPIRAFRVVAALALVLSFVTPFTLPGAPGHFYGTLVLMHFVAAVVVVTVLTSLARPPRRTAQTARRALLTRSSGVPEHNADGRVGAAAASGALRQVAVRWSPGQVSVDRRWGNSEALRGRGRDQRRSERWTIRDIA